MNNELDLANEISKAVISEFNRLPAKGKPSIKSNGIKEWSVLAGIVAIISDPGSALSFEIYPLTISTGVKSVPFDTLSKFSNGLIVHDLHAEILSIRCLNWFLINEYLKIESDTSYVSKILEKCTDRGFRFKVRDNVRFSMFISEPPCGDASMLYLQSNLADDKPWDDNENLKRRKIDGEVAIQRGRSNFDRLGIVRTKPGRTDSSISLSKSCSDKLCIKQLTSLLNSVTSQLIDPMGVYLDSLVLENSKFDRRDIERCFYKRFVAKVDDSSFENYKLHKLNVFTCDTASNYQFHKESDRQPSSLSLIYIVPFKRLEVMNNGVKNGSFVKNKPVKPNNSSIISCQQLLKLSKPFLQIESIESYTQFKQKNSERIAVKSKAKEVLGNWVENFEENFDI